MMIKSYQKYLYFFNNNVYKKPMNEKGFSLIEVMIVIAIIGILVSIAYPAYVQQAQQSRRADCSGSLVSLATAMERFFTTNNTYATAIIGAAAGSIYPNQCPIDGGTPTYNLTIMAQSATAYTIQAAPIGAQVNDRCGTLTLTQTGLKTASDGTVQQCWQ